MNSRERITQALLHKEADRVPIDLGGTDCSSIHLLAYDALRKELCIEPRPLRNACLLQQIAEIDNEILSHFHADAKALPFYPQYWKKWSASYGVQAEVPANWEPTHLEDGGTGIFDINGNLVQKMGKDSLYFDPVSFPLMNINSPAELDKFDLLFDRWDYPAVYDETYEQYGQRAQKIYNSTDRFVVALWRLHLLQAGQFMRGYENFLIDIMIDETLVNGLLEKLTDVYINRISSFAPHIKNSVDAIFLTDDLGTQDAPLISPETYRKMVKPYMKKIISHIKKVIDKPVIMHTCGAVSDFIPDLIEIGVDVLNPVQITAAGMDPKKLKKEFGKDIAFWGGGCSTQGILDHGSPEQVAEDVKRNIDAFAPGGGFVFTQVHNIQAGVPIKNIITMFETAFKYSKY